MQRAKEKGLAGMVGRVRLLWEEPFENSHEINLYAFARFMENPDLSIDEVARDWAVRKYGEGGADYIASAYKRTQFINHHGRYHLGFWLTKSIGSEWDDYRYYFGHLMLRSRFKWTRDPADKELETRLYFPDIDIFNQLIAEKDEVLRQISASLKDLKLASRYLTREQLAPLEEEFNFLLDAGKLSRQWTWAFFAQRLNMQEPKDEYPMLEEDAFHKLEELDTMSGVSYGLNPETGHRYNIDHFVLEMRWRMANPRRARAEDQRILEQIKAKMDVRRN